MEVSIGETVEACYIGLCTISWIPIDSMEIWCHGELAVVSGDTVRRPLQYDDWAVTTVKRLVDSTYCYNTITNCLWYAYATMPLNLTLPTYIYDMIDFWIDSSLYVPTYLGSVNGFPHAWQLDSSPKMVGLFGGLRQLGFFLRLPVVLWNDQGCAPSRACASIVSSQVIAGTTVWRNRRTTPSLVAWAGPNFKTWCSTNAFLSRMQQGSLRHCWVQFLSKLC